MFSHFWQWKIVKFGLKMKFKDKDDLVEIV